jgi:hypothetical protein
LWCFRLSYDVSNIESPARYENPESFSQNARLSGGQVDRTIRDDYMSTSVWIWETGHISLAEFNVW